MSFVALIQERQYEMYLPFLIGVWLGSLALGLIAVLFWEWVVHVRPTDDKWTRILVWLLMLPTLLTSAISLAHCHYLFTSGFGDYGKILSTTFPRTTTTNFAATRVPAAIFFAIRAWRLNNRPMWFPIIVGPCL